MKPKELPESKSRDLIPPDMDYRYFEGRHLVAPEPDRLDYSPANAWWFAECAFLVYCHPGFARMAGELAGFPGFRFFHGKGTECMVLWNDDMALAAFRGTEMKSRSALHEIRTDLNTIPVPFPEGGKVHRGFLLGLEEVWEGEQNLRGFLKELTADRPDRPLWITGHSLGGALAALCFARTPEARGLYIYGAPHVGNADFIRHFEGRSVWRFENARDPVPLVPPDLPKIGFEFKDIGTLKYLDSQGRITERRPDFVLEDEKNRFRENRTALDQRVRDINKAIAALPKDRASIRNIRDRISEHLSLTRKEWKGHMDGFLSDFGLSVDRHQPVNYAVLLWNALANG